MNSTRLAAIGAAAHAVVSHLHRRSVPAIDLDQPVDVAAGPAPTTHDEIEEKIRLALSVPAAELYYAGGTPADHLTADRHEVIFAHGLAQRLGGADPVAHMERALDDTLACISSPRIWHAIRTLSDALMWTSPRGAMDRHFVEHVVRQALANRTGADFSQPAHPRAITVRH